jgi:hypothetical protein
VQVLPSWISFFELYNYLIKVNLLPMDLSELDRHVCALPCLLIEVKRMKETNGFVLHVKGCKALKNELHN